MGTEIDFIGFSGDCRVEGHVDLEDARLADLLNSRRSVTVRDVTLVSMVDVVRRSELDVVVASGPRGAPKRRLATKPTGVTMKLGPYNAEGFMHAPPTANPVRGFNSRPTMVALTDAVLEYQFCNERDMAKSLRSVANPGGAYPGAA